MYLQRIFYISIDESQKPNEQKKPDTNEYMMDDFTYRKTITRLIYMIAIRIMVTFGERNEEAYWGAGNVCFCVLVTCDYTYVKVIRLNA